MKTKIVLIGLSLLVALLNRVNLSNAATATSVSQNGITWTFSTAREVGQFVNGDWWVVGPVTIINITPAFDGLHNGWESNPAVDNYQGLEAFTYGGGWDASLVPKLPYNAVAGESLLKGVSIPTGETMVTSCRGDCLRTASILTVVSTPPGANVFRPPYMGTTKPLYSTDDLHTELLPTLPSIDVPPTIQSIVDRYKKVQLNHEKGGMGRAIRPQDHMNDYQPENTTDYNNAIMRMMLNDSVETKMPALIQLVQYGIDTGYSILNGQTFPAGGGHQPGHRIVAAFAATMLDITALKAELNTATYFHEDEYIYEGSEGKGLWGEASTESGYWNYIMGLGGSRTQKDPYGYIDGGKCGMEYQLLTVQAHKGEILATILMPSLQSAWNPTRWAITRKYVERWVKNGIWSQLDPCAPFDGVVDNYGKTYGADSTNPGMCILDPDLDYYNGPTDFACQAGKACGRYPEKHTTMIDGGLYPSSFVRDMWDSYYLASTQQLATPSDFKLK